MANFARRVVDAGAAGLVLFNRFYQPDLDLESRDIVARVEFSQPWELRLPLRWIAILRPQLGADVAMLTSALLKHGPQHLRVVEQQLVAWLAAHDYASDSELRGSASHATAANPTAFERANYMRTLHSWTAPHEFTPASPSS